MRRSFLVFGILLVAMTCLVAIPLSVRANEGLAQDMALAYEENVKKLKSYEAQTSIYKYSYSSAGDVNTTTILSVTSAAQNDKVSAHFLQESFFADSDKVVQADDWMSFDGTYSYCWTRKLNRGFIYPKDDPVVPVLRFVDVPTYFKREIGYRFMLKYHTVDVQETENDVAIATIDIPGWHRYKVWIDRGKSSLPIRMEGYNGDNRLVFLLEVGDFLHVTPDGPWIARSAKEQRFTYTASGERRTEHKRVYYIEKFEMKDNFPPDYFQINFATGTYIFDYVRDIQYKK